MKSMTSAEFHLVVTEYVQRNRWVTRCVIMFILKGYQFRPFLVILLKRRHANMTLFLLALSFRFCWRAPNSLNNINCSSCYSWLTARFLIAIYTCLSHTSHTFSHSCKCRNSEEICCLENALETLAEHAEYFSSSSMLQPLMHVVTTLLSDHLYLCRITEGNDTV